MQSWIFSIITPVFSVTWSFRNHLNMLIWCSRNISSYYQCWKQLLNIFLNNLVILWWTAFIWSRNLRSKIFCNIINVFTVTFDQFNASLLNKSINFIPKIIIKKLNKKSDLKFLNSGAFVCQWCHSIFSSDFNIKSHISHQILFYSKLLLCVNYWLICKRKVWGKVDKISIRTLELWKQTLNIKMWMLLQLTIEGL